MHAEESSNANGQAEGLVAPDRLGHCEIVVALHPFHQDDDTLVTRSAVRTEKSDRAGLEA